MPCISVIMPLYNKELYVQRAVNSVLAQTVQDFEILVVNDGSTDKGPEIIRAVRDNRIMVIDQRNAGVSAARNRGIGEAHADLIAFLDADDEWEKDYLESVVNLREKFPYCDVFATSYWFSSPSGYRRRAIIRNFPKSPWEGILNDYFTIAAKSDPPLWTSAVVVTKQAINAIGGFPVGVISGEDLLTWAKLAVNYKIAYSAKPCAIHYNPTKVLDRPGRTPQEPDIVGNSLRDLINSADAAAILDLKAYIALWHRMRAVIFIQLGNRRDALKEIREAMQFAPSAKLFLLRLIAGLPGPLPAWVFTSLKKVRTSS